MENQIDTVEDEETLHHPGVPITAIIGDIEHYCNDYHSDYYTRDSTEKVVIGYSCCGNLSKGCQKGPIRHHPNKVRYPFHVVQETTSSNEYTSSYTSINKTCYVGHVSPCDNSFVYPCCGQGCNTPGCVEGTLSDALEREKEEREKEEREKEEREKEERAKEKRKQEQATRVHRIGFAVVVLIGLIAYFIKFVKINRQYDATVILQ